MSNTAAHEIDEPSEEEFFSDVSPLNGRVVESVRMSTITIYHSAIDLMQSEERIFKGSVGLGDLLPLVYPKLKHFRDNARSIDFVLVWVEDRDPALKEMNKARRRIFESQLAEDGLELELETIGAAFGIVKVHAPRNVLKTYCDVIRLRLPIKEIPGEMCKKIKGNQSAARPFSGDLPSIPPFRNFLTFPYSKEKSYLFDEDDHHLFTPLVKTTVVRYILERAGMRTDTSGHTLTNVGIQNMVNDGVYKAAYPLHDGTVDDGSCLRGLLIQEWASLRKLFNFQPIDHVKEYVGARIAWYFTWLGFYTSMLVPAVIVGTCCFLYGCFTLASDSLSSAMCDRDLKFVMCPRCLKNCYFWTIQDLCFQGKFSYVIDNPSIVIFSLFMSIWATVHLKLWKRYSDLIAHRWSVNGCSPPDEPPRPSYLVKLSSNRRTTARKNVVSDAEEPYIPFWKVRLPRTFFKFSLVIFMTILALVAVISVVFYRTSVLAVVSIFSTNKQNLGVPNLVFAAVLNLAFTLISNNIYQKIATYLTELELWRTQNEFDESRSFKLYAIQFVNFFVSIWYIAYVKGVSAGHSGDFQEECNSPSGGCMLELTVQLVTTMVGLQLMNGLVGTIRPILKMRLASCRASRSEKLALEHRSCENLTDDYKLLKFSNHTLLMEYLEIVVQYSFVTLFAAAFQLSPLIALIYNIFKVRLDARKLLRFYRRPTPAVDSDIGAWYGIIEGVNKLAIFSNGMIIAFTSTLIPKLVYKYTLDPEHNIDGFLNVTLGVFNSTTFAPNLESNGNVTTCRHVAASLKNDDTLFWHVVAARLIFFVVFQVAVFAIVALLAWLIPDIPPCVRDHMKTEEFLTNQLIIQHEADRARKPKLSYATATNSDGTSKEQGPTTTNHVHFGIGDSS